MTEGFKPAINVPFLGNVEVIKDPTPLHKDHLNFTSLPSVLKSWENFPHTITS